MKYVIVILVGLVVLGVIVGLVVVFFGLFDILVWCGYWVIIDWVMYMIFENVVKWCVFVVFEVLFDLDDLVLIELGVWYYVSVCVICYVMFGCDVDVIIVVMVLYLLQIQQVVKLWQFQYLYWIVDQGVKMIGMFVWFVEGCKDEVWVVVVFLNVVCDGMMVEDYIVLIQIGEQGYCVSCYGLDGMLCVFCLDIFSFDYIVVLLVVYCLGV